MLIAVAACARPHADAVPAVATVLTGPRAQVEALSGFAPTAALIDPRTFDHARTGWPLGGAHAAAPCAKCHVKINRRGEPVYRGLDAQCAACHAPIEPHQLHHAVACDRCHTDRGWRPAAPATFDHATTNLPLVGAHREVACARCHPGGVYGLGTRARATCDHAGCHPNAHGEQMFGMRDCALCHSPSLPSMTQISFDHEAVFPIGNHRTMACAGCHPAARGAQAADVTCERCHAQASPHGDRFAAFGAPARCATCHSLTSWTALAFDHAAAHAASAGHAAEPGGATSAGHASTWQNPMRGHRGLACRACHRGGRPDELEDLRTQATCKGCHTHQLAHADADHPKGKFKTEQCLACHFTLDITDAGENRFDHATSSWPLEGKHRDVPCRGCHASAQFKSTPRRCAGCHTVSAFHRTTRSDFAWYDDDCGGCHSTRRW